MSGNSNLLGRVPRWTWIVLGALLLFVLSVDDWGRDLTSHEAAISNLALDESLRPLASNRATADVAEAVRWAAKRIRNWEYVGEAEDGDATLLLFVRTNRLLRIKDDVTIRIEDRDGLRVVTGESISRLPVGDLGRNPRNLRRFLTELRAVLDG
jgi:hypothetical protein